MTIYIKGVLTRFKFHITAMGFWPPLTPLTITHLYVPRGAIHEAPMDCKYDLEGELLYDVKWYKDDMQFFRCLANGSVHEFPLDGVSKHLSPPHAHFHKTL